MDRLSRDTDTDCEDGDNVPELPPLVREPSPRTPEQVRYPPPWLLGQTRRELFLEPLSVHHGTDSRDDADEAEEPKERRPSVMCLGVDGQVYETWAEALCGLLSLPRTGSGGWFVTDKYPVK